MSRKIGRRTFHGFLIAGAVLAGGAVIAGCGGDSPPKKVTHRPGTVTRAVAATAASGFRMNLAVQENLDGSVVIVHATGSFTAGFRVGSMSMDMQEPAGSGGPTPFVIANGTIYERVPAQLPYGIPGGKPWLSLKLSQVDALSDLPGLYPFINESFAFADVDRYMAFLDAVGAQPSARVGRATVNGARVTRYQSVIDIASLLTAVPTPDQQDSRQLAQFLRSRGDNSTAPVNILVDGSGRVRRLSTSFQGIYSGDYISVGIVENFTSYGPQPAPAAPGPAQTTNLLSLVAAF